MKQSSVVDWIFDQLFISPKANLREIMEKAKAMHKEEIMKAMAVAFRDGLKSGSSNYKPPFEDWEQYYNETYGK